MEFKVLIYFYNGLTLETKLLNSNLVLLQQKVRIRNKIKYSENFWFDKEGLYIDTRCIMSIKETLIDDDNI